MSFNLFLLLRLWQSYAYTDKLVAYTDMLVAYPFQEVAINSIFYWLFMICLEIDTLSSLPFSEQVDYAQTIGKIHKRQSVFKTSTHGFNLLLQHVRVMKHILITTVKYFLARLFQSMYTLLQKCSNSFSKVRCIPYYRAIKLMA